jgi:tetratricopeptide (TPR) repeat protein
VAINLASVQLGLDQRTAGDATLRRAYEAATAIRADGLAAIALLERANEAASAGNHAAALSLSQLALPLIDRPGVSPRTQVRIRAAAGSALYQHGDPEPAVAQLRSALALIATHQLELGWLELQVRVDLVEALGALGGHSAEAVELARSTLARERQQSGERSANFGIALNTLALSLRRAGDIPAALAYRRQALEAVIAGSPAGHSRVVIQRSNLALDLLEAGQFDEAWRESAAALAQSAGNEGLVGRRPELRAVHGVATFGIGRHREGIELVERAVLESTSQSGKDHPDTLEFILWLVRLELELGRVDAAAQHVAALEEGYRAHPLPHDLRLPVLRGTAAAAVALARGQPREAEALARGAAAAPIEDDARGEVLVALGRSLVAQGAWGDARGVLAEALAIAARWSWRRDRVAAAEVVLAEAEYGAGDRAAGRDRARRARDVLVETASRPGALAEVRRFLRTSASGARPIVVRPATR